MEGQIYATLGQKECVIQYFAFSSLVWADIQILTSDLDSSENFASGGIYINLFAEGQIFQQCRDFAVFYLL